MIKNHAQVFTKQLDIYGHKLMVVVCVVCCCVWLEMALSNRHMMKYPPLTLDQTGMPEIRKRRVCSTRQDRLETTSPPPPNKQKFLLLYDFVVVLVASKFNQKRIPYHSFGSPSKMLFSNLPNQQIIPWP